LILLYFLYFIKNIRLIVTRILCWWSLFNLWEIFLIILLIDDLLRILSFFISTLRSIFEIFNFQWALYSIGHIVRWKCSGSVASWLKVHAWLRSVTWLRKILRFLLLIFLQIYWDVSIYLKSFICNLIAIQFWISLLQTVS
jgi:hypothetical protein